MTQTAAIALFKKTKDVNKRLSIAEKFIAIERPVVAHIHKYPNYPNNIEIFADIPGYEGIYQVGNFGTIKSVEGFFIKNRKGGKDKMAVYRPESVRKFKYSEFGYLQTSLWLNGSAKWRIVHRLVAMCFIPNPNNLPMVLHKDDNPSNARWDNLQWGTQSDNILDCSKKNRGFRGILNNNSKLSEDDIPKIRKLLSEGVSSRKIATMFGVTKSPILWIKHNKSWSHIK